MRRVVAVSGLVVAISACVEAFSAHVDVVARAGRAELSVARLSEIIAPAQSVPLEREYVDLLARRWVEFTLLGQRAAAGDSLLDSMIVIDAMWPDVHQAVVDSFLTVSERRNVKVTPEQVDSAFQAGNLLHVAHVLRRTGPQASAETREAQRAEAARIRQALLDGGSWAEANEANEDSIAKSRGGSLGAITRGATVPQFEDVAFGLEPGEISDVTETSFGFHVIMRPELDDVREEFVEALEQVMAQRADSLYELALLDEKSVSVKKNAPASIRETLSDPFRAKASNKVLATFDGGRFVVSDLVRWISVMRSDVVQQIPAAPDDQLLLLVRSLVVREVMWNLADSAGVWLDEKKYGLIRERYAAQLANLRMVTRLFPDSLQVPTSTMAEREELAQLLVDRYLEAAVRSNQRFLTVPIFLADRLMDEGDWEVRTPGVVRVLQRAREMRSALQGSGAEGQE
jgi:hypothetical protein